ncbi:lytic transglycosylase domain-containing protein [Bacteroidia bacterium]|nr:lytic transglycosylase domain-containing protein [Bacteroidia bacterium]MDB9883177.1 lytic transglycosylase domain-containing protein [Bacteroidia bacterium]
MKLKNVSIPIIFALFLVVISSKDSEQKQQEDRIKLGQKIYPAPIPSHLSFAGESVPLEKFEVSERLDRELLVNTYWQSNTMLILKRTKKVFLVIEPILEKYGVPNDFKYLAVAESSLINATSSAGAKGVWQFMKSSGRSYGLQIDEGVDERYNLIRSTEAACLYLKEAYTRYGNWTLAAASYNRGMSGITRDLNKQLVNDYFDLHLNTETSRYILRIIALKTIIKNPKNYGFMIEDKDYYASIPSREIYVDTTIMNISEYAQSLGSNYHIIKSMNPWIIKNELKVASRPYTIKAPLN